MKMAVLGAGRSGTSIMGEVLRDSTGHEELFEPWIDGMEFGDDIILKLPKSKNRDPGNHCEMALIPDFKIVWMIRHPLDCIASHRAMSHDRSEYLRFWGAESFANERDRWIWMANNWVYQNTVGIQQPKNKVVVRYEDLLEHNVGELEEFLGISLDLSRISKVSGVNEAKFQDAHRGSNYKYHVGRWQTDIPSQYLDDVKEIVKDWL